VARPEVRTARAEPRHHGTACPTASPLEAQVSGAAGSAAPTELPCTAVRSLLQLVILVGARLITAAGPGCDLMQY